MPRPCLPRTVRLAAVSRRSRPPVRRRATRPSCEGGRVHVRPGTVLEGADVLIEKDLIKAVGTDLKAPEGATVVDLGETTSTPGMIDPLNDGLLEAAHSGRGAFGAGDPTIDAFDVFLAPRNQELLPGGVLTVGLGPHPRASAAASSRLSRSARRRRALDHREEPDRPVRDLRARAQFRRSGPERGVVRGEARLPGLGVHRRPDDLGDHARGRREGDRRARRRRQEVPRGLGEVREGLRRVREEARRVGEERRARTRSPRAGRPPSPSAVRPRAPAGRRTRAGPARLAQLAAARAAGVDARERPGRRRTPQPPAESAESESAPAVPSGKPKPPEKPRVEPGKEALVRVLKREVPLWIVAHWASDIDAALELAKTRNIRVVLAGATEAARRLDAIKDARVVVALGAPFSIDADNLDRLMQQDELCAVPRQGRRPGDVLHRRRRGDGSGRSSARGRARRSAAA